ncbi:MAG: hypothetical protein A2W91_13160 [Bacteroidetes bacterium GWF2_38_335]|nr:MAG: hypothetical protein A2W91_13160 [Bacteroidetes bacterium GWF2_38_335]OFY77204.1 MAG: hypothetical protein A2281_14825 [Bacteroidetes bacterium RIFOXYA12_FULL_38_20]HBS85795.1 hypothetical protein [Bacteroidales bacterium]
MMTKPLLMLLLIIPAVLFATVGEPCLISNLYYSKKANLVYYERDCGYSTEFYKLDLLTGENIKESSFSEGEYEALQAYRSAKFAGLKKLKETDIKVLRFSVEARSAGLRGIYEKDGTMTEDMDDIFPGNIRLMHSWNIYVSVSDHNVDTFTMQGCYYINHMLFRGYTIPGKAAVIMISSADQYCYEGGYYYETAHLIKHSSLIDAPEIENPAGIKESYGDYSQKFPSYRIKCFIDQSEVASQLNAAGQQAIKEEKYLLADNYFAGACDLYEAGTGNMYEKAMYNRAKALSLCEKPEESVEIMEKLVSVPGNKDKYLVRFISDKDFEKTKKTSVFKIFLRSNL